MNTATYEYVWRRAPILARKIGPMRRADLVKAIMADCACSYDLANSAIRHIDPALVLKNTRKKNSELLQLRASHQARLDTLDWLKRTFDNDERVTVRDVIARLTGG